MFLRLSEKSDHIFQIYARVVSKNLNNTFACVMIQVVLYLLALGIMVLADAARGGGADH
jgi:hypothetical protein